MRAPAAKMGAIVPPRRSRVPAAKMGAIVLPRRSRVPAAKVGAIVPPSLLLHALAPSRAARKAQVLVYAAGLKVHRRRAALREAALRDAALSVLKKAALQNASRKPFEDSSRFTSG